MAEIRPFKGIRYNLNRINDLAAVICPPYDVISPQLQDELYGASDHNFVRIEYNRELPQDNAEDNRYTRAAATINRWLKEGVLQQEDRPAIYIHQHSFAISGRQYRRENIIACVKLEEWETRNIRPHENIMPKPKSDRMNMLRICQANTSPVLALYKDPQRAVSFTLTAQEVNPPLINIVDNLGERHKIWVITQPETIRRIEEVLSDQPLYIADGHHRYDSALSYRREQMSRSSGVTGNEGYNYVMMSLVDFADPGLVILPTHRLVRGIPRSVLSGLKAGLQNFFELEEIPLESPELWNRVDTLLSGLGPESQVVRFGLYGLETGSLIILTLRDFNKTAPLMPSFHSGIYHKLDVSLVDHIILQALLGLNKEKEETSLAYVHDREEAVGRVRDQEYQLLFILNPVMPELIQAIADEGDRMPRKSTYFYPKSPAGLVFYRWQK